MKKKPEVQAIAGHVYDGAAAFGVFMSIVGLIFGILTSIGLIIGGVYLIRKKNVFTSTAQASVLGINCHEVNTQTSPTRTPIMETQCDVKITYMVNDKAIVKFTRSTVPYSIGDVMTIRYNPNKPTDTVEELTNFKVIGYVLIGIAIFILVGVSLQYYIVSRFKFAAAAAGVGNAIQMA